MKTLEERLSALQKEDFANLKQALQWPHINPREKYQSMPYFKYNLVERITDYLVENSNTQKSFEISLRTINKEPLKRTYYGILSLGKVPENVLNALTDWQKIFFLTGRWEIRNPDLDEPGKIIIARHLFAGLKNLYKQHFIRKADGQYTRELRIPEDKETREQVRKIICSYESPCLTELEMQEYNLIVSLLKAEESKSGEDLTDAQERTAIALDRTNSNVLKALSKIFSQEQLGEYFTK